MSGGRLCLLEDLWVKFRQSVAGHKVPLQENNVTGGAPARKYILMPVDAGLEHTNDIRGKYLRIVIEKQEKESGTAAGYID